MHYCLLTLSFVKYTGGIFGSGVGEAGVVMVFAEKRHCFLSV